MFVKPSSAFVGKPSLVASSSGRAKKARYARLLPSTRKSSASRAGASLRSSSAPVSVFGDIWGGVRPRGNRPLPRQPPRRRGRNARGAACTAPRVRAAPAARRQLPRGGREGMERGGRIRRLLVRRLSDRVAAAEGQRHVALGQRGESCRERWGRA